MRLTHCILRATHTTHLYFIIFADGHVPHIVLLSEFFGQRGAHLLTPDVRGRIEVALALLPSGGGHKWIALHDV